MKKEYLYNIGDIVKTKTGKVKILKQFREFKRNEKSYQYECLIDGYIGVVTQANLKKGVGCSVCGGKTVIKGINDISTTHPFLLKYFVDINDAYTHTYGSSNKILAKCPDCGYKKMISINNLRKAGFGCPKCGDGISYPEKVISNILKQLGVDFIGQYTRFNAEWCDKYRYDFYFEYKGERILCETHGLQHFQDCIGGWNKTLIQTQENDRIKKELALDNGIKEENYIVIDCRYSTLEWCKGHILDSRLNKIFDLSSIDWVKIGEESEKSLVKEVCDYWHLHNEINSEELTTSNLSEIFQKPSKTIRDYLKKGVILGWCKYNPQVEAKKSQFKKSTP